MVTQKNSISQQVINTQGKGKKGRGRLCNTSVTSICSLICWTDAVIDHLHALGNKLSWDAPAVPSNDILILIQSCKSSSLVPYVFEYVAFLWGEKLTHLMISQLSISLVGETGSLDGFEELALHTHEGTSFLYSRLPLIIGEAVYWVSIGHYEAVAVGTWWYWVSRGHLCLYILH